MEGKEIQLSLADKEFLADKKWWVEEVGDEYLLFVKYRGEVFKSIIRKSVVDYYKEGRIDKKMLMTYLVSSVRIEIIEWEAKLLEDSLRKF